MATKGNLVVAQGGGPTAVINSSLCGITEQALQEERIGAVYGARYGLEGVLKADFVDLGAEHAETLQALRTIPGAALGSSRERLDEADYHRLLEVFEDRNVRHFLYIGGNGSMAACHRLHTLAVEEGADVQVIGVPKTVDNDIAGTDHCPGYGSACRYYAVSLIELSLDVESLPTPVSIFETMGRNAGWLAAAAGLARRSESDAPHLVYVPENPLSPDRFLDDVRRVYDDLGWVVAAVGEGAAGEEGEALAGTQTAAVPTDDFDRTLPGGAAAALARLVGSELGLRARSEKPGLCGRASIAHTSQVDRREAYELGQEGVRHSVRGARGVMVALQREEHANYSCTITTVDLGEVAGRERTLPAHFMNEAGNMVSKDFRDYAEPLLGGALPRYARLKGFERARQDAL